LSHATDPALVAVTALVLDAMVLACMLVALNADHQRELLPALIPKWEIDCQIIAEPQSFEG
jgi:hypothetical protein